MVCHQNVGKGGTPSSVEVEVFNIVEVGDLAEDWVLTMFHVRRRRMFTIQRRTWHW
jgi:hypothetical protein